MPLRERRRLAPPLPTVSGRVGWLSATMPRCVAGRLRSDDHFVADHASGVRPLPPDGQHAEGGGGHRAGPTSPAGTPRLQRAVRKAVTVPTRTRPARPGPGRSRGPDGPSWRGPGRVRGRSTDEGVVDGATSQVLACRSADELGPSVRRQVAVLRNVGGQQAQDDVGGAPGRARQPGQHRQGLEGSVAPPLPWRRQYARTSSGKRPLPQLDRRVAGIRQHCS